MGLIINADDFGRSPQINRAVIRAHVAGVLNSASLMIAGDAADEAIELARQHPKLAVGLHVVAVDGPAVLPPRRLPHLVGPDGSFPNAPVRLGIRYASSRTARRELRDELTAQFDRFASSGLALSHVDGHQHMHMHPAVFKPVLDLARRYGARRVRVVRDDLWLSIGHERRHPPGKFISTAIFAALAPRCRVLCRRADMAVSTRTYGFLHSGRMNESYVLAVLERLNDLNVELYFHPTEGERLDALGPNPGDLATLLSPRFREALEARQLLLSRPDPSHSDPFRGARFRGRVQPMASKWC